MNTQKLADVTRRHFLSGTGLGLGAMALSSLLGEKSRADLAIDAMQPLAERRPQFTPRAKQVIYLHLTGSPPNLDVYDYKPELVKRDGQECPQEFLKGKTFAFTSGTPKLMGTPRKFAQYGQSGAWLSDAVPNFHADDIVDEMCFIHSMNTDQFNHAPAELLIYTGSPRSGRPALGSWVTYGLGTENQNLPGFVVLISSGVQPNGGSNSYGSGFLPSVFQGVQCRSMGDPVLYVSDPVGMNRDLRRRSLDTLHELNQLQADELGHPDTLTRIAQYELAFRMQASVPEVMNIKNETRDTLAAYGAQPGASSFANNCLLARRLIEQGVRYVQLFDWGWDFHGTNADQEIETGLVNRCKTMEKPVAALIRDLKQRGMLQDTLIVWAGEFGRTPMSQGGDGRDHHNKGFTVWLAGGGVRGGLNYGATDELGYAAVEDIVTVHDLHATMLHLLGIEHERFSVKFQGLDAKLSGVEGAQVVAGILA
jgi:hypothetical protein